MHIAWVLAATLSCGVTIDISSVSMEDYRACGPISLYCFARLSGIEVNWDDVRRVTPVDSDHMSSIADLISAADNLGLATIAGEVENRKLGSIPLPAIAHLRNDPFRRAQDPHYVVIINVTDDAVTYVDPPFPIGTVSRNTFNDSWTGVVLLRDNTDSSLRIRGPFVSFLNLFATFGLVAATLILIIVLFMRFAYTRLSFIASHPFAVRWNRCRRWLLTGAVLVVVVAGTGTVLFVITPTQVPQLDVVELTDLGRLEAGKRHHVQIPITNSGAARLFITRTESTCGCLTAVEDLVIEPGSTAHLPTTVNVSRGRGTATIHLISNSSPGSHFTNLRWHGYRKVEATPSRIRERHVPRNRDYVRTVTISGFGVEDSGEDYQLVPKVTRVSSNHPNVNAALRKDVDGHKSTVLVSVRPSDSPIRSNIRIDVLYADVKSALVVPVDVDFADRLTMAPSRLTFSAHSAADLVNQSKTVHISVVGDGALSVTSVPDWLNCHTVKISPGKYSLEVVCSRAPFPSEASTTIMLDAAGLESAVSLPVIALFSTYYP